MASNRVTQPPSRKSPPAPKPSSKRAAKPAPARKGLDEVMRALEKAGTAQTRKTYARHGAQAPMFGVSFAVMKTLVKRIGVDHELALELWNTGNHDARVLAMKIADPARMQSAELDRWGKANPERMWGGYVAMLAAEGPHGRTKAREWLASSHTGLRAGAWTLIGCLANLDETTPDDWFAKHVEQIEKTIHSASNSEREAMNRALITIGGRSAALRKAATAAAKRIGRVEVDHGDTACTTPEAVPYIERMWAHSSAKGFDSPAAQERSRESMRTRC